MAGVFLCPCDSPAARPFTAGLPQCGRVARDYAYALARVYPLARVRLPGSPRSPGSGCARLGLVRLNLTVIHPFGILCVSLDKPVKP